MNYVTTLSGKVRPGGSGWSRELLNLACMLEFLRYYPLNATWSIRRGRNQNSLTHRSHWEHTGDVSPSCRRELPECWHLCHRVEDRCQTEHLPRINDRCAKRKGRRSRGQKCSSLQLTTIDLQIARCDVRCWDSSLGAPDTFRTKSSGDLPVHRKLFMLVGALSLAC